MCPDRQIISLYFDRELPSPWNEKMEAHLESCPQCRAVLAGYRGLGGRLGPLDEQVVHTVQSRVWKHITAPELIIPGRTAGEPSRRILSRSADAARRVWNRRVTLPLPAAAAAAIFVLAAFFSVAGVQDSNEPEVPAAAMNIGFDDYTTVPIHDMDDVIRHLSVQETADFMVIRLPEHRSFSRPGQPTLINASDYSMARRNFHR